MPPTSKGEKWSISVKYPILDVREKQPPINAVGIYVFSAPRSPRGALNIEISSSDKTLFGLTPRPQPRRVLVRKQGRKLLAVICQQKVSSVCAARGKKIAARRKIVYS